MSSNPANEQLSAYLDGELEDAEAASIEAALAGDSELRAELDRLKRVQRLLRTHGRARAPEGFAARVIAAAEQEAPNVVALPWWRRPFGIPVEGVLVAAAAALVLIVALPRGGPDLEADPTEASPAVLAPEAGPPGTPADAKSSGEDAGEATVTKTKDAPKAEKSTDGIADADEETLGGLGTKGTTGKPKPVPSSAPAPKPAEASTGLEQGKGIAAGTGDADPGELGTAGSGAEQGGSSPDAVAMDNGATEGRSTEVENVVLTGAGLLAQVYSDDEALLGRIQAIVARYEGRILDANGKVIETGLLEPGETTVFLDIPQEHMSAVNKGLAQLGTEIQVTSNKMAGSDRFRLPLRIVITASEPSTGPTTAPNAAKQRMQYDEAEAVDQ